MRHPETEFEAWFAGLAITDGHRLTPNTIRFSPTWKDRPDFERFPCETHLGATRMNKAQSQFFNADVRGCPVEWANQIPPLPSPDLRRHYVRGLIDGDGNIVGRQIWLNWRHDTQQNIGEFFLDFVANAGFETGKPFPIGRVCTRAIVRRSPEFMRLLYLDASWFLTRKRERVV